MAQRNVPRVQSGPFAPRQSTLSSSWRSKEASPRDITSSPAEAESPARACGGKNKLSFSEFRGDLFQCPGTTSLAHCVSEDMAMGKGIAKVFKRKFEGKEELIKQGIKTGGVAVLERKGRCIFYLVTKAHYSKKPTYDTLKSSLVKLCKECTTRGIHELAMPQIGCGLDQLDWPKVRDMIKDIFADYEIKITIYYL